MRKILIPVTLTFALMLTACGPKDITLTSADGKQSATVKVEIADSPSERTQGLMGRTQLTQDTGMLFVFKDPDMLTFWMKDTKIPLEILFFDKDGSFVNALRMEPCAADPCTQYKSAALSLYALEVPPDFRKAHGIGVGWKLDPKQIAGIATPK